MSPKSLKIAIVNKSDSTGGAAVVSFRLMEALRRLGVDARMVVTERLTDSPFVVEAAPKWRVKIPFLLERLKIFMANGFNRSTLFKIDTASDGLRLLDNEVVREADVVMLNWVNQGMLSLHGLRRLSRSGKKIIWTMHDMWCFTGICHHSGECLHYEGECKDCWLLKGALDKRLSHSVWRRKLKAYRGAKIAFVAVSRWLASRGSRSSLFDGISPTVIPNAFPFDNKHFDWENKQNKGDENREIILLFGAARLDDSVKGLPILVEATKILARDYPEEAARLRLVTFGESKDPDALSGVAIAHTPLGRVSGKKALRDLYYSGDIVVSTSLYETLPGTLVEGQAYGCIPVAFPRGGQGDIIDHLSTGYLAPWSDDMQERAGSIAKGIVWAMKEVSDDVRHREIIERMYDSAYSRFNEEAVAEQYLRLISEM